MARETSSHPLRRQFRDRSECQNYLREIFADILVRQPDGGKMTSTVGGRDEAERLLRRIDPQGYKLSRNHLRGKVTYLSPYIRHGVIGLAEIRDAARGMVHRSDQAEKLISELGWRDYWQRVYARVGDAVWEDQEPYKTGYAANDYRNELPAAVTEGRSGLACMDAFATELTQTGYLHNHARLWVATYAVHWLKVQWQRVLAGSCATSWMAIRRVTISPGNGWRAHFQPSPTFSIETISYAGPMIASVRHARGGIPARSMRVMIN